MRVSVICEIPNGSICKRRCRHGCSAAVRHGVLVAVVLSTTSVTLRIPIGLLPFMTGWPTFFHPHVYEMGLFK